MVGTVVKSCLPWGTNAMLRHSPDIAPFCWNRHTRPADWQMGREAEFIRMVNASAFLFWWPAHPDGWLDSARFCSLRLPLTAAEAI